MSHSKQAIDTDDIRQKLLDAGMQCFLARDYNNVSMRQVASKAGVNMSMIYYYFGNKEGFFEEILRNWMQPMIDDIQSPEKEIMPETFEDFFQMYYRSALAHPRFPLLILKTLNSTDAPGARFLCETLLERARNSGLHWVNQMKVEGKVAQDIDPEMLRVAFVSMSMMPMLMRDLLAKQFKEPIDEDFFARLSSFYERVLCHGIVNNIEHND